MTYEDEVIKAAKNGFAEVLQPLTPEMEKLLRLVYKAGYNRAKFDALQEVVMHQAFND